MSRKVAIVAAVRTPIGRHGGALSSVRPDDLAAHAIRAAVAAVTADGATIDLLVNNAGVAAMNALLLTPPEVAAELMRVNYLGSFHCLQAVGKARVRARRGRIGIILQAFHLLPTMTALENVATPLELAGIAGAAERAAAEQLPSLATME